ncbi:hypothetical protein FGO68_gene4378 [Halteria grandinella]|uniref:Uncharacterized protein n=1 Tax=Halteria grandinella TaxID=5974 RepID=A0A8J8T508_HALGN|nr:hypothetical protein FGO68_gene4378 [Halteria grandinella]
MNHQDLPQRELTKYLMKHQLAIENLSLSQCAYLVSQVYQLKFSTDAFQMIEDHIVKLLQGTNGIVPYGQQILNLSFIGDSVTKNEARINKNQILKETYCQKAYDLIADLNRKQAKVRVHEHQKDIIFIMKALQRYDALNGEVLTNFCEMMKDSIGDIQLSGLNLIIECIGKYYSHKDHMQTKSIKDFFLQANQLYINKYHNQLNIMSVVLLMNNYSKIGHEKIEDWTFLMRKFLEMTNNQTITEQVQDEVNNIALLDQQLFALSVACMSKFIKLNFLRLDKELIIAISQRSFQLVTWFGEANGMPFNKVGIVMLMQGLGRLQEYMIKATPKPQREQLEQTLNDPLYLSIIHQELRNILNVKRNKPSLEAHLEVAPVLATPQDLNELICGIRELQLKGLDDALIQSLVETTQQFLKQAFNQPQARRTNTFVSTSDLLEKQQQSKEVSKIGYQFNQQYAAMFFSWAFLCTNLEYREHKSVKYLMYDLANHMISVKNEDLLKDVGELCTMIRTLSMLQDVISQEIQKKVNMKAESYVFIHIQKLEPYHLAELVTSACKLQLGGTVMLWRLLNTKIVENIDRFGVKDIIRLDKAARDANPKKVSLDQYSIKLIKERHAKNLAKYKQANQQAVDEEEGDAQ